jgi:type IV pilus assembly protein PilA
MLYRLRQRSADESGFTLIELLVVILIIGILAAIAIPAFLNQKGKAQDASAKVQARTAQTAAETYGTDHNGEYTEVSEAALKEIEPTLKETGTAKLIKVEALGKTGYKVESESVKTGNKFKIERKENGEVTRECTVASASNRGACPGKGTESGDW